MAITYFSYTGTIDTISVENKTFNEIKLEEYAQPRKLESGRLNVIAPGISVYDTQALNDSRELLRKNREREQAKTKSPRDLQARESQNSERNTTRQYIKNTSVFDEANTEALLWIIQHESGFNQYARNKNCCGLFQRLNYCSQEDFEDLDGQIREGTRYIKDRYGSPLEAKEFWLSHNWY